jgi:N-acetylmuramoyl-L-alanine amidase
MKKIWIDAGHGGIDSGAVGFIKEKDINLKIANLLGIKLSHDGYMVKYTRMTDIYYSINQRIKMIKDFFPDILISIHCNGVKEKLAHGFEIICRSENKVMYTNEANPIDMKIVEHSSHRLARLICEQILDNLNNNISLRSKPIIPCFDDTKTPPEQLFRSLGLFNFFLGHQNDYFKKLGTLQSRVLIECGFVTNQNDSEFLNSILGEKEMVNCIYNGIKKHIG